MKLALIASAAAGIYAAPAIAAAQTLPPPGEATEGIYEREVPRGIALHVGGGIGNFVNDDARARTGMSGGWDLRLTLGSRQVSGLELAYRGSAHDLPGNDGSYLLGNGLEGVYRLNLATYARGMNVTPFAFAGVGWHHYEVMATAAGPFDADQDDILTIPFGAGLSIASRGLYFDARFTYRPTFAEDLLAGGGDLATWGVAAHIGAEF